jgi:hypothetical protein
MMIDDCNDMSDGVFVLVGWDDNIQSCIKVGFHHAFTMIMISSPDAN